MELFWCTLFSEGAVGRNLVHSRLYQYKVDLVIQSNMTSTVESWLYHN